MTVYDNCILMLLNLWRKYLVILLKCKVELWAALSSLNSSLNDFVNSEFCQIILMILDRLFSGIFNIEPGLFNQSHFNSYAIRKPLY